MDVASDALFKSYANRDVWIFGDTLEHFKDPWSVLTRIRKIIPNHGCIVTCIPNAQHWSIQARLNCGDFRYESSGLLDQTHLRWFTRQTMLELFESTGYRVIEGMSRFVDVSHPNLDSILSAIRAMAEATGTDPEIAVSDAIPFQYVLKAVPI